MIKNLASMIYGMYISRKKRVKPARRTVIGFAVIIAAGAVLLMLPISSKTGEYTPFMTALFTSASATCVTGLVLVDTGAHYSYFGQAVILTLIQIGGLGFMTIITMAFIATHKNVGVRYRMLIAQSFGLNDMSGGVRIIKKVINFTIFAEVSGAIFLMLKFIPQYGVKGIWYGVFYSVSAFCNAGFDVFGNGRSLMDYSADPYVLTVISALIIVGGLGFIVWDELTAVKSVKRLSMYTRLVIIITAVLLIVGTVVFMITDADTFANGFFKQLGGALFQSVTTRTAGFDAVMQADLSEAGKMLSIMLMMIGGASGSTAGGVKIVTVGILVIAAVKSMCGKNTVVVFGRNVEKQSVMYASALIMLWLALMLFGAVFVNMCDNISMIDALYECASAYGTVGLSVGVTAKIGTISKILFIFYMFFGRVGIMTISMMFMARQQTGDELEYPSGNIFIG